jgi:DNA-binding NarL/FixJ family response regulator
MTNNLVKVAIIEDQRPIRDGLSWLIDSTEGFACTGSFPSVETALARIKDHLPDIVLTDIGLPGKSGIEGVRELKQLYPSMQFLMLSVYDDDERVFEALCAGACGYLLKKTPPARLLESLREVAEGGAPMSPEVASRVIKVFRKFHPPKQADYRLTPQEQEILKLIVQGHYYKTAAHKLGITTHTVSFHLRKIYDKLQVHTKSEAVAKAISEHLI